MKQIIIYWERGAWRFDELSLGIKKEPFVLGSSLDSWHMDFYSVSSNIKRK